MPSPQVFRKSSGIGFRRQLIPPGFPKADNSQGASILWWTDMHLLINIHGTQALHSVALSRNAFPASRRGKRKRSMALKANFHQRLIHGLTSSHVPRYSIMQSLRETTSLELIPTSLHHSRECDEEWLKNDLKKVFWTMQMLQYQFNNHCYWTFTFHTQVRDDSELSKRRLDIGQDNASVLEVSPYCHATMHFLPMLRTLTVNR